MIELQTTYGVHAPGDCWPGDTIHGFEWPVNGDGYKVRFKDDSTAYYPAWDCIPNRILKMQVENDAYQEATVTAITWENER